MSEARDIRIKREVPPATARWAKLLIGLGVSVAVALAPLLGTLDIPLFTPLLNLIPVSIRGSAIPVSAALMGIAAVVVEWNAAFGVNVTKLKRAFKNALIGCVVSLVALLFAYSLLVARVPIEGGRQTVSFIIGFSDPRTPPCQDVGPSQCISDRLGFNETVVASHFGERQIRLAEICIQIPYFVFFVSFGALVGALTVATGKPKK